MPPRQDRYPESPVFYRSLKRRFPRIAWGKGCFLYDTEGKRYLDGVGGAFVANVGQARQSAYLVDA
ncbi:MAG: hypothetical protein AAB385_03200, partial [Planctomycetota bacterium]